MKTDVKEKIIATAADLVIKNGYHAVSINEIIRESGTSKGSLYYHFPNGKEDIVIAFLRSGFSHSIARTTEILNQSATAEEAFNKILDTMIADVEQKHEDPLMLPNLNVIAFEASDKSPRITEECSKFYETLRDLFAAKIREDERRTEQEAKTIGFLFQTGVGGSIFVTALTGNANAFKAMKEGIHWMLEGLSASSECTAE